MRTFNRFFVVTTIAATTSASFGQVRQQLRLWGLDADDNQLFAIDDVTRPTGTFRDFGSIWQPSTGEADPGPRDVGGFTVVGNRYAYIVVNTDKGSELLTMDLRGLTPGGMPPTAKRVGDIDLGEHAAGKRVTGLAAGHLHDAVYALVSDDDPTTPDELYTVDDLFSMRISASRIGPIVFGEDAVCAGGDISIGPRGNVLITDDAKSRIVAVDPATGAIVSVRQMLTPAAGTTTRAGGLAWDVVNDRTACFDASSGSMTVTGSGAPKSVNLARLGVVDAEGMSFVLSQEEVTEPVGGGGFSNIHAAFVPRTEANGSPVRASGGGGGGSGHDPISELFPDDYTPDAGVDPEEPGYNTALNDDGGSTPGSGGGGIIGDGPDTEPGTGDSFTVTVPAPAGSVVLFGAIAAACRRRARG